MFFCQIYAFYFSISFTFRISAIAFLFTSFIFSSLLISVSSICVIISILIAMIHFFCSSVRSSHISFKLLRQQALPQRASLGLFPLNPHSALGHKCRIYLPNSLYCPSRSGLNFNPLPFWEYWWHFCVEVRNVGLNVLCPCLITSFQLTIDCNQSKVQKTIESLDFKLYHLWLVFNKYNIKRNIIKEPILIETI